nr:Chain A, drp1 [synthetic construct]
CPPCHGRPTCDSFTNCWELLTCPPC